MSGLIGKAVTVANQEILAAEIPGEVLFGTIGLDLTNMGTEDAKIKIALSPAGATAPAAADYIEFNAVIPANGGILERGCKLVSPGEKVFVNSDKSNVAVRVTGVLQAPAAA